MKASPSSLDLLDVQRQLTEAEDQALASACRDALGAYRATAANGQPSKNLTTRARRALLHLGGDPDRRSVSLKDYDHVTYGPFLGISDEGSAAGAIREAAFASPKVRALPKSTPRTPLVVGVAVDAERLGGVGEIAVGPEEYADIWLASVDRLLVTTNIGTRVNVRVYKPEPRVVLKSGRPEAIEAAKAEIAAAFKPFVDTPDKKPRPLTVFVQIDRQSRMTTPQKKAALAELAAFVTSGKAAGKRRAPDGQVLGLAAVVRLGRTGQSESVAAIDLASSAGLGTVLLEGAKRRAAAAAISQAGLLDYFEPGLVGPILRKAKEKGVQLRAANLPDTETIARSIWVSLTTARSMGANLGKYGCFPLTRSEIDRVVEQIQGWLPNWSAAPVFFVDEGLLREGAVDVGSDLPRGIEMWLDTVAAHGVRVVLIDTINKATGNRLLRKSSDDKTGYLGMKQIERIEAHARKTGIKVLWAGGMGPREVYAMGRLGVFGIYVTSAAATLVPVGGSYVRDPALAGMKEPSKEAVLRMKILLEAGFLSAKLGGPPAEKIGRSAEALLSAIEAQQVPAIVKRTSALGSACATGWRTYWKASGVSQQAPAAQATA